MFWTFFVFSELISSWYTDSVFLFFTLRLRKMFTQFYIESTIFLPTVFLGTSTIITPIYFCFGSHFQYIRKRDLDRYHILMRRWFQVKYPKRKQNPNKIESIRIPLHHKNVCLIQSPNICYPLTLSLTTCAIPLFILSHKKIKSLFTIKKRISFLEWLNVPKESKIQTG